jgi:hypothetical protein
MSYNLLIEAKTRTTLSSQLMQIKPLIIQCPFMIKALMKLGVEGMYLNIIKAVLQQTSYLMGKN